MPQGYPKITCTATNKKTKQPCRNAPIPGGTVCRYHGGNTPVVRAAATRRLEEQQVTRAVLKTIGKSAPMASVQEVYAELLQIAGTTRAWREILEDRVEQLDKLGYEGFTSEQIKADVQLFERALERSFKIAEGIARLNLDERKQALDQKTGHALAEVIARILDDLELTPKQRELAATAVPERLREMSLLS